MRVILPIDTAKADALLPDQKPDGSGVGINYADAMLKPLKLTLEDGRRVAFKRRGLKITLSVGDQSGSALLRRIEYGPDVRAMFRAAMQDAARSAGVTVCFEEDGTAVLEA